MLFKTQKYLLLLLVLLTSWKCNNEISIEQTKTDTELKKDSSLKLSGQLYFVAPEFDTLSCKALGACDCCADLVLFVNDSVFITVEYCTHNNDHYKGTYKIKNNTVYFYCDSLDLNREFPEEVSSDSTQPLYVIKKEIIKRSIPNWVKMACRNDSCFKLVSNQVRYCSPNNGGKEKFITQLKKDSIDIKLGIEL